MIVLINGIFASGIETISQKLAESLDYELISMEKLYLKESGYRGITLKDFKEYLYEHPEVQREIDFGIKKKVNNHDNIIVTGSASLLASTDTMKIYLHGNKDMAALRLLGTKPEHERSSLYSCAAEINRVHEEQQMQSQNLYGVNIHDLSQYDLCIKTDNKSIDDIVRFCQMVVAMFQVDE